MSELEKNRLLCSVAIPVYKSFHTLSADEIRSLNQVLKVLSKYDVFFIGNGKIIDNYLAFGIDKFPTNNILSLEFDEKYFRNIDGYNRLLISKHFYTSLGAYQYVLIYQLDAYVFEDRLAYWCNQGFDYIGAPWYEDWHEQDAERDIIGVGNGGFSLRKIEKNLKILNRIRLLRAFYKISLSKNPKGNLLFIFLCWLFSKQLQISGGGLLPEIIKPNKANEDFFWCMLVGKIFKDFTIAPVNEAIKFAFEVKPEILFKTNNQQLPFGCHAWQRYNPSFWKAYIH